MSYKSLCFNSVFVLFVTLALSACSDSGDGDTTPKPDNTPINVSTQPGDSIITLSWDDIAGAQYNIYMGTSTGVTTDPQSSDNYMVHTNVTNPFVHPGLQNETAYYFVVSAVVDGVESPVSGEVFTTPFQSLPPVNVSATTEIRASTISWDTVPNAIYNLYMGTTSGVTKEPLSSANHMVHTSDTNSFRHTGLEQNTPYYFVVTAVRNGIESDISQEVSVTPWDLLTPQNVVTQSADSTVTIAWDEVPGATYNLYMDTVSGVGTTPSANSKNFMVHETAANPYVHTDLQNGTTYYFVVAAVADGSLSDVSVEVTGTPIPGVLPPPGGLTGDPTTNSVSLNWGAVSGATSYNLYRADVGGITNENYTTLAGGKVYLNITAATFNDTVGLQEGQTYYYAVSAVNSLSEGPSSTVLSVTMDVSPPTAPNALSTTSVTANQVILTWEDTSTNEQAFVLERVLADGSFAQLGNALDADTNTFSDTTITPGSSYDYRIKARNSGGDSAYAVLNAVAVPLPAAPTGLTLDTVATTTTSVTFTWTDANTSSDFFIVERSDDGGSTWPSTNRWTITGTQQYYTNTPVTPGSSYVYRVKAQIATVNSAPSDWLPVGVLPNAPTAPADLAQSATANQVVLTWTDASDNELGFRVGRRAAGSTAAFVDFTPDLDADILTYTDVTVVPSVSYDYQVTAFNAGGSSPSVISNVAVPNPIAPSGLTQGTVNTSSVTFTWTDNNAQSDAYYVERLLDGGANWEVPVLVEPHATSFTDNAVTAGATIRYRVVAEIEQVSSIASTAIVINVPQLPPTAPSGLTVGEVVSVFDSDPLVNKVVSINVPLSWVDNSDNESGFRIERQKLLDTGLYGDWATVTTGTGTVAPNITSFTDTSANFGTIVNYRVVAFNTTLVDGFSNVINVEIQPVDSNSFLAFANKTAPRYQENAETAQAYYDAIDPGGLKDTFAKWSAANGFSASDSPAIYLNDADLGFGRRMYLRTTAEGNVASYVENFASLDDAILGDPANMIATVAMEYTQPANDPVKAAAKEVVIAKSKGEYTKNFSRDILLDPGDYTIVVARSGDHRQGSSLGTYTLSITFSDNLTSAQVFNGAWTMPEHGYGTDSKPDIDPSNPIHTLSVATRQSITVNFESDLIGDLYFRSSKGKIITEDDNSGGGVNARIAAYSLAAGTYYVMPTVAQKLRTSGSATLSITGEVDGVILAPRSIYYNPVEVNDPSSPYFMDGYEFTLTVAQNVTIDLTADIGSTTLDPYVYLAGVNGTGADIIRSQSFFAGFPPYQSTVLILDLPAGNYTAVPTTDDFNQTEDFTLTVIDTLSGTDIPFNLPTPLFSWSNSPTGSGGTSPFRTENPRFGFSITPEAGLPTKKVTIELTPIDPPNSTFNGLGNLYVLGAIGDYRHIIATETGTEATPNNLGYAQIKTTLSIGDYTLVAGAGQIGLAGDFEIDVIDNSGTSLMTASPTLGSWIDSGESRFDSPTNPRFGFSIEADNTPVTITLTSKTGPITDPVLWLLDSADNVLAQNSDPRALTSQIETDLLAGNYQFAVTTGRQEQHSNYTIEYTIDGIAQPPLSGSFVNSQEENPYSSQSPRVPEIPIPISKNSHIIATLTSNVPVRLYLLGQGDQKITTFYTFIGEKGLPPGNPDSLLPGDRVLSANLDGRGEKYQPGVCNVCHGGYPRSLVTNELGEPVYPDYGDTGAGFLAWDLDLYKYRPTGQAYDRLSQEAKLKEYNHTVLGIRRFTVDGFGEGHETTRNLLIKGWYGGTGLPNAQFDGTFVPPGWMPDSITNRNLGIPDGADELYLQVIKPTCRLCHTQRDGIRDPVDSAEADIALAFGTYKHFMRFKTEIENTVYDKAVMPLALRTYNHFWQEGQAELLAQHLDANGGFSKFDNNGKILLPGRPIANAGFSATNTLSPTMGNREIETNVSATLNGNASIFASTYNWTYVGSDPAGYVVTLTGADTAKPSFKPALDDAGDYTFQLVVGYEGQISDPSYVTVKAVPTAALSPVSFATDIMFAYDGAINDYVQGPLGDCEYCHMTMEEHPSRGRNAGELSNKRLFERSVFGFTVTGTNDEVYRALRNRVNLDDPLQSMLLKKATGYSGVHGGGKDARPGYGPVDIGDPAPSWEYYDIILKWILEGAPNNQ